MPKKKPKTDPVEDYSSQPAPTLEQRLANIRDKAIKNIQNGPPKTSDGEPDYKSMYFEKGVEWIGLLTKNIEYGNTIDALRQEVFKLTDELRDARRLLAVEDEKKDGKQN